MAKRLPRPYQRPGVGLTVQVDRGWRWVLPWELAAGDTLADFGLIGGIEDLGPGYVRLTNSVTGQSVAVPTGRVVYAFVKLDESEPAS